MAVCEQMARREGSMSLSTRLSEIEITVESSLKKASDKSVHTNKRDRSKDGPSPWITLDL